MSSRCLVVDDEPAILRLVAIVLRDLGCQTLTAEVQATDTRGRRQLEPDAGTIRVAR